MDHLEELQRQLYIQFRRPSVSYETKQYANQRLQALGGRFRRVTRPDAYEDHFLTYIQAEREKFRLHRQTDPDDLEDVLEESPYDDVRRKPLCGCSNRQAHRCPVKRGQLPREMREASDLDAGAREFRANHDGNPYVITDAQDAFSSLVAEVEHELRDILAILASDEIPETADWPTQAPPEQPAD